MNKLSKKIEKVIKTEIKAKEVLIKTLKQDQEDYSCDNSKKIKELEEVINYYESVIDGSKEA